jgi:hypothetical protein
MKMGWLAGLPMLKTCPKDMLLVWHFSHPQWEPFAGASTMQIKSVAVSIVHGNRAGRHTSA